MATGRQVALAATTATKIADNPMSDNPMYVRVTNGGSATFFGGPNVTNTVFGGQMAASAVEVFTIAPEDELWAYNVAGLTLGVLTSP